MSKRWCNLSNNIALATSLMQITIFFSFFSWTDTIGQPDQTRHYSFFGRCLSYQIDHSWIMIRDLLQFEYNVECHGQQRQSSLRSCFMDIEVDDGDATVTMITLINSCAPLHRDSRMRLRIRTWSGLIDLDQGLTKVWANAVIWVEPPLHSV